jgi:hypothetical protein
VGSLIVHASDYIGATTAVKKALKIEIVSHTVG